MPTPTTRKAAGTVSWPVVVALAFVAASLLPRREPDESTEGDRDG